MNDKYLDLNDMFKGLNPKWTTVPDGNFAELWKQALAMEAPLQDAEPKSTGITKADILELIGITYSAGFAEGKYDEDAVASEVIYNKWKEQLKNK